MVGPGGRSGPFVVNAGNRGEPLAVRGWRPDGRTHLENGLDADSDFSCAVPARYGAGSRAGSPHVCTTRAND